MDDSGALPGEMSRRLDLDPLPLDPQTAERILAGSVPPADTPPGYADVARVLRAASGPPAPAELAGEVEAVALLAAELRAGATTPSPVPRRSSVLSRALTARFAAAAVAGTLSLTTGLAAADVLPDSAQDVASTVLDKVGIDVPTGDPGADVDMTVDTEATVDAPVSTTATTSVIIESGNQAPDAASTDPAPNVLSLTGAPAGDDAGKPNHGTAVCKVASDGKCKPDHDEDGDDDPAGQGNPAGYAKQIEHCQDKGQTKQARFQEQGKTKQSDKAVDQAQDCEEKFENKKAEPAEPADPTTDTTPGNSNAGSNHTDDSGDDESDDDETDDDESDDDDEQGDDNDDDAHPPADPGSKGQGQKKGHDHAPGQSGRQ